MAWERGYASSIPVPRGVWPGNEAMLEGTGMLQENSPMPIPKTFKLRLYIATLMMMPTSIIKHAFYLIGLHRSPVHNQALGWG